MSNKSNGNPTTAECRENAIFIKALRELIFGIDKTHITIHDIDPYSIGDGCFRNRRDGHMVNENYCNDDGREEEYINAPRKAKKRWQDATGKKRSK